MLGGKIVKHYAVILILAVFVFASTGCSANNSAELIIWHETESDVAAVIQAELDKLRPEIVVRMERKNGLTEALKMVGNDPRAAPDFYFFAHDKL